MSPVKRINIDKTKAIWIGTKQFSDEQLCTDYNLDWNKGPFKVLGVTFSLNEPCQANLCLRAFRHDKF